MFIFPLIYVFRTSVRTRREASRVCEQLKKQGIVRKATLDLDDCDRVLRVETMYGNIQDVMRMVLEMGVSIEILD